MKNSRILSCFLILLIAFILTPNTMFAAPSAQSGTGEAIQIVLVLDSSGSMGAPVYTGIVPEDLLSLLLRMDELQNDPQYINLTDQVEEAENDPAVSEAKEAWRDAFEELSDWITANQGISLSGNQAIIRTALKSAGCDDTSNQSISTAGSIEQIEFYLNADCPAGTVTNDLLAEIVDLVPYLDDPQYQALREAWQEAFRLYDETLESSGFNSYSQQLEDYKKSGEYQQVRDEIDRLVALYSIPSRLELAKSAAINLIDLSQLDKDNSGRDSLIGLVTFSNQAMFEHGLTLKHDELKPLIRAMIPLQQTNIGDALLMGLNELESNADPDQPKMVILLSDGHANVGLSSSEILAVIPTRANSENVTLCTAGFADIEAEVDFVLLEGLAHQTGGEYLFTNSGAELGSFFAACREAAAGKELAEQITGIVGVGDIVEVGRVEIEQHTCDLSLALNFLSGMPLIELIDPEGNPVDPGEDGITYQTRNQVQLLTVENPMAGEWVINLSNEDDQGMGAAFSILVSTNPCAGPGPEIESPPAIDLPYLLSDQGMPVATGGVILIVVLLAGATGFIIRLRQRRAR
jgi:Mg-chelatase subunit ChlD